MQVSMETLKNTTIGHVPHSLREIVTKLKDGRAKNVVTMVGAGISTAAGIPDFRSISNSFYTQEVMKNYKLPYTNAVFDSSFFEYNPEPLYALLKECMMSKTFKPTNAHYFIKLLEEKGMLRRHYTQNIDGLDRMAGIACDKLIEAHGTLRTSHCSRCQKEYSLTWLRAEVNGSLVPKCSNCTAVVKPDIVLFGDPLPNNFTEKISSDYAVCDLLIVMGTSLVVEPFASLITSVPAFCPRLFINKLPLGEKLGLQSPDRFQIPGTRIWLEGGNRDAIMLGESDDCVEELARMVGWQLDLEELIQEENRNTMSSYQHHID